MNTRKAIIIGGGIGGLCAAIALHRAGIAVEVYERAAELREVGAGLALWSNAIKAMKALGVWEQIQPLMVEDGQAGGILTQYGKPLLTMSSDEMIERYGSGACVVHRAEFHAALMQQLPAGVVHTGAALVDFVDTGTGIVARFADGRQAMADFLIGADGLRSVVRQKLFPANQPRYAGYSAWRGIVAFPHSKIDRRGEFWGKGLRFGIAPVSKERVYWFCSENVPEGQGHGEDSSARKAYLLARFGGWYAPISELIRATDADAILRHDIYDIDPLPRWTAGRVTLLGDAAHAMTPNLGQGACQAIEDAVVLGRCLENNPDVTALEQYEALRIGRTTKLARLSRTFGEVGQWQNTLACIVRNFVVGTTPAALRNSQFNGILGYDVTL